MSAIPASSRWIFWDVDPEGIDPERDANGVLARVLERGCLDDVAWLMKTYGLERIHAFFRDVWAPEISDRTRGFWRAFFEAENETWAAPPCLSQEQLLALDRIARLPRESLAAAHAEVATFTRVVRSSVVRRSTCPREVFMSKLVPGLAVLRKELDDHDDSIDSPRP